MSTKIQIVEIDNINYIISEDLFEKALIYTKGSRNARELIKKKKIDDNNYIYAAKNKKDGKWNIADGSSKKVIF